MSTHTPGPWTLYNPDEQRPLTARGNPSDKRIVVLHPDQQRLIACCNTGTTNKDGTIPREERLANARLIAAAPDMLLALRNAEAWLGKMIADGSHTQAVSPEHCERTLDQVTAAIAAATSDKKPSNPATEVAQ